MKAVVAAFNQEKALVGAFSVIVKTDCGTDGSFYNTNPRPPGSSCGQEPPLGRGSRGTWSKGTDQRMMDYPQMLTTEWRLGSVQVSKDP